MTPNPISIRTCIATFIAVLVSHPVAADPLIWDRAARHAGVPVKVIHGIALTESGRKWGDGMKRPWPWTLNSARGSMFFSSRDQAAAALSALIADGLTNIDIGYMQINCYWHCARVARPADLLDPQTNLTVAAQILKEAKVSKGGDVASAVGAYHAGLRPDRTERALWYRNTVASHIRRLPQAPTPNKGS